MSKKNITVKKNYIILPRSENVGSKTVVVYLLGKAIMDLTIRLDYINPVDYSYIDVSEYMGKELEIEVSPEMTFKDIQSDDKTIPSKDAYRPSIHFTPKNGWINDPNGLFEYTSEITGKKTYNMFYQYNPYDNIWGNMHWGHAVCEDLLHWKECPIALYPDNSGTIFSGSAVVDKENRSNLREGDEAAILLFYTSAGNTSFLSKTQKFTQCIAYSTDGGKTFKKYANNPVIENITDRNRDPKVIWCDELGKYVMALYLEKNQYGIFVSENLLNWEFLQKILIEGERECPDLYPLYADGDKAQRKWVLSGASAKYVICEVSDNRFNVISAVKSLTFSEHSYASQTFFDIGNKRRISIAWNRKMIFPTPHFNGQMGIPLEITLTRKNNEYFLLANKAFEFHSIIKEKDVFENTEIDIDKPLELEAEKSAYYVELDGIEGSVNFEVFGKSIEIDVELNIVKIGNYNCPLSVIGENNKLQAIIDACSIELISGIGEATLTVPVVCDYNFSKIQISSRKSAFIKSITVAKLEL